MRTFLNSRGVIIAAIVYALAAGALWLVPLFNVLHVESSAVIAGISFFVAGLCSIRLFKSHLPFLPVLSGQLLLLLVPWFFLTLSILWQPNCSYGQGLLFYLIFTVPTVCLSVAFAYLVAASKITRKKTLFIVVGLGVALGGVIFDLGFHSQFFTYSHVFGGVLGPIYDEELFIRGGLLAFRGRTLLLALLCWMCAESMLSGVRVDLRMKKGIFSAGIFIVTSLIILSFIFSAALRINTPAWFIKEHLGGHVATDHFDLYFDESSMDSSAVAQLVDEHEYRYQFIHQKLGIDVTQRIQSFIYPDAETKDWLTGSRNTSVAPVWLAEPQMHMLIEVFDRVFPHELGHVFSREFGLPIINASLSVGLVEGLAESLEPAGGRPSAHEQVLTAVSLATPATESVDLVKGIGLASRLSPLGFWTGRGAVSYTTMGSFVDFLAETYGYERFMQAYARSNFEDVFGKSVEELEAEWADHLMGLSHVDRSAHAYVTRRFSIPSLFEKRCPHYIPQHERDFRAGATVLAEGDTLGALTLFEKSLDEVPTFEAALSAWAAIKTAGGAPEEVISTMRATYINPADSLRPQASAGIWVQYGDALALRGDSSAAYAAFDSALVRLPLYAYQQRGLVALRRALAGAWEVQKLNRSSRSTDDKIDGLNLLEDASPYVPLLQAILLAIDGTHAEALVYLDQYTQIADSSDDEAINLFSRILHMQLQYGLGQLDAALEEARLLEHHFLSLGAFNSAKQYADFANKMSYIISQRVD